MHGFTVHDKRRYLLKRWQKTLVQRQYSPLQNVFDDLASSGATMWPLAACAVSLANAAVFILHRAAQYGILSATNLSACSSCHSALPPRKTIPNSRLRPAHTEPAERLPARLLLFDLIQQAMERQP
jgi:hypothetical protein